MQHDEPAKRKSTGQERPLSERDQGGRFQTGNIGGPGRPRRSRNLLGEEFVAAVHRDWAQHGAAVLARVRIENPGSYLRVIASLVPRDVIIQRTPSEFDDLSDAELVELLQEEARALLEGSGREEQWTEALATLAPIPQTVPSFGSGRPKCRFSRLDGAAIQRVFE